MADTKITALTENTTPAYYDEMPLVDNTSGAPSTQKVHFGKVQNWIMVDDTWTYASPTTITVPTGAASIYSKGDRITLAQGGTAKYFYIIGVADTILTITAGSTYSLVNAAISSPYFSRMGIPTGFPISFGLTAPTWTASGTAFANQPSTNSAYLSINGQFASVFGVLQSHATSSASGVFYASFTAGQLPTPTFSLTGAAYNSSTYKNGPSFINNSAPGTISVNLYDGTRLFGNSEWAVYKIDYIF